MRDAEAEVHVDLHLHLDRNSVQSHLKHRIYYIVEVERDGATLELHRREDCIVTISHSMSDFQTKKKRVRADYAYFLDYRLRWYACHSP